MKSVTCGTTPTLIDGAGNRDYINIYNNGANTVFLQYDGGDPTSLTVSNGWPVPAGTWYVLSNDGNRNVYNKAVYVISAAGGEDLRIQGA